MATQVRGSERAASIAKLERANDGDRDMIEYEPVEVKNLMELLPHLAPQGN